MNRLFKFFFIIIFILTGIGTANAQVEIVSSDIRYEPGNDLYKQRSTENIEFDLGEAGADQSWDFSGIELEGEYVNYIDHLRDPEGRPGADAFPTANIVYWEEAGPSAWVIYSYLNFNEDNINFIGMAITSDESDTAMIMEVETIGNAYSFPMAYNDEWSYVLNFGDGEELDTDSVHCVVDAWGTITDLAGTFDCIRIQRFTREFEQNGEDIETDSHYEFLWLVPEFGDIVTIASVDNEENPDFTTGHFTRTAGIEMTSVNGRTEPGVPAVSCLEPAYPNPFNPHTTLRFKVAQQGMITINIYDICGRTVSSLVSESYSPGSYSVDFNAIDLSSGTYFAKFSSGNNIQTQKLLLTK